MREAVTPGELSVKAIILASILYLASGIAGASDSNNCEEAKQVVEQYIALDLLGEGTHTSEKMRKLIDYQGRDTPGWDSFVLTSESRIKGCKDSGSHTDILIAHKVFGTVYPAGGVAISQLTSKPLTEDITGLRLTKTAQGWKIDSPTVYVPHVGIATAKKLFR
jgi:hypothetical protein